MDYRIRRARPEDAKNILDIYRYYVESTVVSFEFFVPAEKEIENRILTTLEKYPYLVAEDADKNILGYAYGSEHMSRAAYQWNVELSVYIAENAKKMGVATALYQKLFLILKNQGYVNAYACIVHPYPESEKFHEKIGFKTLGVFPGSGFKKGAWHDIVWMEYNLVKKKDVPKKVIPFQFLKEEILQKLLEEKIETTTGS